jgi:hypothetical protein
VSRLFYQLTEEKMGAISQRQDTGIPKSALRRYCRNKSATEAQIASHVEWSCEVQPQPSLNRHSCRTKNGSRESEEFAQRIGRHAHLRTSLYFFLEKIMLVAINRQFKNKIEAPADFGRATHSFENVDLTLNELVAVVQQGYSFCAQHKNNHRKAENFTASGMLAVDIDHDITIDKALEHPFVKDYGGFIYTTVSHTEEAHRFRIVFELDEPITNRNGMEHALTGLISKVGGDEACKDACRIFFGNESASITKIGKSLPSLTASALALRGLEAVLRETVGENKSQKVTVHSSVRLNADLVVKDRSGQLCRFVDMPAGVSIHCPQHIDHHASAFTLRSGRGTPGIHCTACSATFYLTHEGPYYDFDYSVNLLRNKTPEEWEAEQEDSLPPEPENNSLFEPDNRPNHLGLSVILKQFLPPFRTTADVILVKSPKGSGKTEWLTHIVEEAKRDKKSVLLIGHRQALIMSTAKRLGLQSYIRIVDALLRTQQRLWGRSRCLRQGLLLEGHCKGCCRCRSDRLLRCRWLQISEGVAARRTAAFQIDRC